MTEENVGEISKQLANLTNSAPELTSDGVGSTADILQSIVALNSSDQGVNVSMCNYTESYVDIDFT